MIKAVIFDLNGVFIQSPKLSDRFKEEFNVPIEEFMSALKEIMDKIRRPDAGEAYSYWKPYLEKWKVDLNKEQFYEYWFTAEKEIPELIELAKKLKEKNLKVIILSNNFIERATYYKENFSFLDIFDKIYYSWQTGFVKPDPEAFKLVLKENDLKAEECLYFDDSEKNIKVATELGMKAYQYRGSEDLKKVLKKNEIDIE